MGLDSCLFIQIRGLTNYIFGDFTINLYRAVQLIHFILLIPISYYYSGMIAIIRYQLVFRADSL